MRGSASDRNVERVWWMPSAVFSVLSSLWLSTRFATQMVGDGFTAWNVVFSSLPLAVLFGGWRWTKIAVVLHQDATITLRYLGRSRKLRPREIENPYVSRGGYVVVKVGRRKIDLPVTGDDAHALVARLVAASNRQPHEASVTIG